jgi:hypothetical protein
MEFRLTYNGPLKSRSSATPKDKHEIRKGFHRQLQTLWSREPLASSKASLRDRHAQQGMISLVERVGPFIFVPLVSQRWFTIAEVDVLFLRHSPPGQLIGHGGDIDNRMKTLFDALRVPVAAELPLEELPGEDQDPFYCLLQDDALVTALAVHTDQLLAPGSGNDVQLIIHVNVKPTKPIWANDGI